MNLAEDECAVKIAVRERPLREIFQNNDVPSVINYHSSNSNILIVDERPFVFDHVLPPSVSQKTLFDFLVMPLVGKVLKGFNCTALAYGQTGTGKSFTMGLNPESLEGDNVGMIPRCVQEFLENKNPENNEDIQQEISASFIEIYSEKVYDLLSENASEPIIARGYKFTGGTKKPIANMQDGYALLNQGTKNRHVRPTKMNAQSSRSHAIFTIYVRNEKANKITQSCLNLVDLAGSEGVRRTGHQGVALSEGVHINQGLLSIGKVLQAITHGYKVIPYRDSVLSSVLQDSLNPNSYFTLLACISPHREDLSETLSTLRFAQSAKNLKHYPQINSKLMELKKSKTPYKINPIRPKQSLTTPTPYKRPFSLVNTKQSGGHKNPAYHGNTFCTPSKKRKTENPKLNHTDVGLTPKEKQKIGSVQMPVSKVTPFSFEPSIRDSLLDRYNDITLDSRASLGLNISTSTEIDAHPLKSSTFSPIVRKCMAEMENTMKSSMLRVLETLKDTQCTQKTPQPQSDPSPLTLVEQKIRNIVRQELLSFNGENKIDDTRQIDSNVRCNLFRASSPIFKVPAVPGVRPITDVYSNQTLNSTQDENFLSMEETILTKPLRRSRRILSNTTLFSIDTEDSTVVPRRRSTRLSSIKALNDSRRRSIRLASHKDNSLKEEQEEEKTPSLSQRSKFVKKTGTTKKKSCAPVNNSIIAGYFEEGKENPRTNTKSALAKHQKAILQMLNSASMKELQYLPQIGLKTAFQIVTQRTLHGKFKNFTQVGKLPIWRGKAWERFKEANNIS